MVFYISQFGSRRLPMIICCLMVAGFQLCVGQQTQEVNKEFARGNLIHDVKIWIIEDQVQQEASAEELQDFYDAFFIKPGTTFNPLLTDLAINKIAEQPSIQSATYRLYESAIGSGTTNRSLSLVLYLTISTMDMEDDTPAGVFSQNKFKDFPLLYESNTSQLKLFLNGGVGLYEDVNGLFAKGAEFTVGNPVADDPTGKETRFWGEGFVEGGISAISKIGSNPIYAYGEASVLGSGRNTSDVYSSGSTAYIDIERLYAGLLATGIGPNQAITINANYGRNFFQLNDGFLFSRYSGSSNAGERGAVYSAARTAFQKTGNISLEWDKFRVSAHFVEPQELFKDRQQDTNYTIGTLNYNNHKSWDVGVSYVQTTGGKAYYAVPNGSMPKKGMYVINPKIWISELWDTGAFLKTEYAYQAHHEEDMQSQAWYVGVGYNFINVKMTPSLYYRYSFMEGDDATTPTYERFDPMLTGGLGNWVQGLNFRKVLGNGNIITHRVELTNWITKDLSLSLDYFYLQADELNNLGGLAPISTLTEKELGHETSITLKGIIHKNITLLGVASYAIPGEGIKHAFDSSPSHWLTVQAALFFSY